MSYKFSFDLTKLPKEFFKDIAKVSKKYRMHNKVGNLAKQIADKFKLDELLEIDTKEAITIIEDLIEVSMNNITNKDKLKKTKKKILLIPHCCRKYMDSRCKARFDQKTSSYICKHCSDDCLANKATKLAKKKNYDPFIIPGSSCIKKLLESIECKGIVGIACTEEIKLAIDFTKRYNIPAIGVPLTKNGCGNTKFNLKTLENSLI
ncbi:MAG: hypothetical protein B6U88_02440 [Candidatus Aenigmarchaeota archaeon ex4484_56]|nr:MAG: hypothetical protein B6U88_02440 [Candidatus Aenigmarchaeota archaeon ex4484_56]